MLLSPGNTAFEQQQKDKIFEFSLIFVVLDIPYFLGPKKKKIQKLRSR